MSQVHLVRSIAAQGDVLFRRIDKLPEDLAKQKQNGPIVVAHSETGHHHSIHDAEVELFEKATRDPMICYLAITGERAEVVHHRPNDTHETLALSKGNWEVRRQREQTPEGLQRRVED